MRVLQIVQKPQRRGAEIFAFQLSRELRRQGHQVQTAYLYSYRGKNALPLCNGDRLLAGQEDHPMEMLPGVQPGLLRDLLKLLDQFQPDVVQVNGGRAVKYGAVARRLRPEAGWALIYRNIGSPQAWVRGWARRLFYRKLVMPQLDGVVGVSRMTLQQVKDSYSLRVPAVHIPNGVDTTSTVPTLTREEVRRRAGAGMEAPVLLFAGSLSPEKRPDRLLRVAQTVWRQAPELQLWLVGDGPLRMELERQAAATGLAKAIHFLGMQTNVADYMNAADLLVLTSDTEGIPAVVLEAGYLGLPTVATRVGGLPECMIEGKTGLLCPPDDEAGLAQAALHLLQRPDLRARMGHQAAAWVRANFTMEIIAQKYLDFYRQVMTAGAGRN